MIPDNFDNFGGGYVAEDDLGSAPDSPTLQAEAALARERVAHYLGEVVAQAEAGARAERQRERRDRAEQQRQMVGALRVLAAATEAMAESDARVGEQAEALRAETRALRSAILLAHSIGGEAGGSSPLGPNVAGGAAERFAIPQQPAHSSPGPSSSSRAEPAKAKPPKAKAKRTRNLSPEARERISAAQKARWAAQRARDEQSR